jgi:hypothetical protein
MEEQAITVKEIGQAANRALEYQRFVFRRTYGVYYLIWAAAMVTLGASDAGPELGIAGTLEELAGLVVLAVAALATGLIFRRAKRALDLRRALGAKRKNYGRYFVAWFLFVFILIAATNVFPEAAKVSAYAAIVPVPLLLYYMLGVAFPDKRPVEGLAAVTVYAVAAVVNLAIVVSGVDAWLLGWTWGVTAVIWIGAAFYALFRAPEELEALRG